MSRLARLESLTPGIPEALRSVYVIVFIASVALSFLIVVLAKPGQARACRCESNCQR